MVRCRLDGDEGPASVRYIPLGEFELWRHLMETKHGRSIAVERVSLWVSEQAAGWNSGYSPDDLEPVLRVHFERPGPSGIGVPVDRFFPAETYPQAQEALLSHFQGVSLLLDVVATPGYFVPDERKLVLIRSA